MKHLALDETKDQDRIIMDLLENRIEFLKDFAKEDVEEMEELEQVKIIRASLQSLKSPTPLTVYTVTIDELPGLSTEVFARIESALDHLLDTVPMRKNSSYTKEQLKRLYFSAERDFWTVLQNLEDDEEEHMVYCLQSHTVSVP